MEEVKQEEEVQPEEPLKNAELLPVLQRVKMGSIPFAMPGREQSNCLAKWFDDEAALNRWFTENPGVLLVHMQPGGSGITCLVSAQMTAEEVREYDEVMLEVSRAMTKRREAREVAEAEAKLREAEAEKERRELQVIGRNCRDHHEALLKDNAALRKEVKQLRRKVKG